MSEAEDRTLPATPRRRLAAWQAGMIPSATLPAWAASVVVTILLLPAWWRTTAGSAVTLLRAAADGTEGHAGPWLPLFLPTAALLLAATGAGLGVRLCIEGVRFHPARAIPDRSRVALLAGLRRILSAATLGTALAGGAWLALMAAVAWRSAHPLIGLVDGATRALVADAGAGPVLDEAARTLPGAISLLTPAVAVAVLVTLVRYGASRVRAERRLRMTPEEMREELRDREGSPPHRRAGPRGGVAAEGAAAVGQVVAGGA
jgi:flagellar biosynthesis protein FlhB